MHAYMQWRLTDSPSNRDSVAHAAPHNGVTGSKSDSLLRPHAWAWTRDCDGSYGKQRTRSESYSAACSFPCIDRFTTSFEKAKRGISRLYRSTSLVVHYHYHRLVTGQSHLMTTHTRHARAWTRDGDGDGSIIQPTKNDTVRVLLGLLSSFPVRSIQELSSLSIPLFSYILQQLLYWYDYTLDRARVISSTPVGGGRGDRYPLGKRYHDDDCHDHHHLAGKSC